MKGKIGVVCLGFVFAMVIFDISKAYSHCDTLDGPVVKDARLALEKGDVTPALKWVKKEAEPEIRAAFQVALIERAKNKEAAERADTRFFEALVRAHRSAEGVPFTGLKPAGSIELIVAETDKALELGYIDDLTAKMSQHLINEVKRRFEYALEKKKHMNESVDAGREYVEAYIEYVHYVEALHNAIAAKENDLHDKD
jgi:hypothetical protein